MEVVEENTNMLFHPRVPQPEFEHSSSKFNILCQLNKSSNNKRLNSRTLFISVLDSREHGALEHQRAV